MGWTPDQVERELVALAERVGGLADRLEGLDTAGWRSLAEVRFREDLAGLAARVRRLMADLESAAATARVVQHALTDPAERGLAGVPLLWP